MLNASAVWRTDSDGGGLKTWETALIIAAGIIVFGSVGATILACSCMARRRLQAGNTHADVDDDVIGVAYVVPIELEPQQRVGRSIGQREARF